MAHPDFRDYSCCATVAIREVAYQLVCIAAVVAVGWYLFQNAADNLARQDIATGFDYLGREAGFIISETPIDYQPSDSYGRALLVGVAQHAHGVAARHRASARLSARWSALRGFRTIRCFRG